MKEPMSTSKEKGTVLPATCALLLGIVVAELTYQLTRSHPWAWAIGTIGGIITYFGARWLIRRHP